MSKPLCIYHGNCADGFTSAWAVWRAHGDGFDYHPGIHQDPPPDVTGRDVVMVDFSYKRPVIEQMADKCRTMLILDHHKSAAEDLAGLPPPLRPGWGNHLADATGQLVHDVDPRLPRAVFDMGKSGARLAWEFFHPLTGVPLLVQYVEDRDLWRFDLPMSREVNAYIFAHEYVFRNWDYLHALIRDDMGVQQAAVMGGAIEKKHHKDVAELVGVTRRMMMIGGCEVPVANLPYTLTSDAGHLMCKTPYEGANDLPPFAACYWDTPEGRVFSLRSIEGGRDVSQIATLYGGGGHKAAAGFRMPVGWEGGDAPSNTEGK